MTKPEPPARARTPLPSLPRHKPEAPRAPVPAPPPDPIDMRLDEVVMEISIDPQNDETGDGISTTHDLAAVRKLFEEVAVAHVAQVRDVMLELRFGEANPHWIEMTKPALLSLRRMAKEMELVDLTASLDDFCAAVDTAVAARAIDEAGKAELLRRYQRLIDLIPQAFELDAERDRREPIIVEALLGQIDGVERPTIDKLFAVGLGRLEALLDANAIDVAAVANLSRELASKIVEHFKAYRSSSNATVAAPDPHAERRKLADLLIVLSLHNDDFNKASASWTDEAKQKKRSLRKQREQSYQQIRVALARLGERDQITHLERLTFNERIATIDRWLSAQPAQLPRPRGGVGE
jgi:hypothetical protein